MKFFGMTKRKWKKLFKHPLMFFIDAKLNRRGRFTKAVQNQLEVMKISCKEIEDFTRDYNVNSIKIGNEYIWPYLRDMFYIYCNLKHIVATQKDTIISNYGVQNGHPAQFDKQRRSAIKNQYGGCEIAELAEKNYQVDFLFCNDIGSSSEIDLDGKKYCRIIDPLYEHAMKYGKTLKIDIVRNTNGKWYRSWINNFGNYTYDTQVILPPTILKIGYSYNLTMDDGFLEKLDKYKTKEISFVTPSLDKLHTIIDFDLHTREYWIEILKILKPKVLLLKAFHYKAPIISAAKSLGIISVDIQHGLIEGWLHSTNHWEELPADGYQALPDFFSVWDSRCACFINKVFNSYAHKPIIMGQPYLEKLKNIKNRTMSQELSGEFAKFDGSVKVLLIMQSINKIPTLIRQIVESCIKRDVVFIVRHHPGAKVKFTSKDFYEGDTDRILISEEIDTILPYELFEKVQITISEGSTLSFEAQFFNVSNVLISRINEKSCPKEAFYYVDCAADFDRFLEQKLYEKANNAPLETIDYQAYFDTLLKAYDEKQSLKMQEKEALNEVKLDEIEGAICDLKSISSVDEAVNKFIEISKMLSRVAKESVIASEDRLLKESNYFYNDVEFSIDCAFDFKNLLITDGFTLMDKDKIAKELEKPSAIISTKEYQNFAIKNNLKTFAQKYLTTKKILKLWDRIFKENMCGKNIFIGVGIYDCLWLLNEATLGVLNKDDREYLINFKDKYKKELLQANNTKEALEDFKNNISIIIDKLRDMGVASINIFLITALPYKSEITYPKINKIIKKYNAILQSYEGHYDGLVSICDSI